MYYKNKEISRMTSNFRERFDIKVKILPIVEVTL